jgi:uncharacterized protein (TIGR03437 family)
MKCRAIQVLFLLAASGFAQNLPRFAFTSNSVGAIAMAVDSHGNTYLTAWTSGNALVATAGAYQSQNNAGDTCPYGTGIGPPILGPCNNSFVVKLNPSGGVVFATYLGGTADARAMAIAVDAEENVYVAGAIDTLGSFPVTSSAAFTSGGGFITKLNASGTQLVYSTLIAGNTTPVSIQVDSQGDLLFAGNSGPTFPATPGAYQSTFPMIPGVSTNLQTVVGKLNASGSALVWATYVYGHLGFSGGVAVATDPAGNVLVAGTDGGATGSYADQNGFLSELSPDGSRLIATVLFGQGSSVEAMKASPSGDIYVECTLTGPDLPPTAPGFGVPVSAPIQGVYPMYLFHLSANGLSFENAIYLPFGGRGGVDVDAVGNFYIASTVYAAGPVTASEGAFQTVYAGGVADVLVAKITPSALIAGVTYFGGPGEDDAEAIAVERDGSVVVAGLTSSAGFLGVTTSGEVSFAANFFPGITIENSASYVANTAVPGEKIAIQGYGLGPVAGVASSPVKSLAGVQVYFDSFTAPIIYAQANQINVQVPWEIAGQSSTHARIVYNGVEVGNVDVQVGSALPGIFYITNADGSFNSPSNPAHAGELVSIFGTGGGAMNPAGVTGQAWPLAPLSFLTQVVSVTVGSEVAEVGYAGSAPTLDSGFFQINVRLPADLSSAAQSLCVTVGGVSGAAVAISVQ